MRTRNNSNELLRSPFGELLYQLRTARGLTQEQLALTTEVDRLSPRSITYYEKKTRNPKNWVLPHPPTVRSIADAMDLDRVDRHRLAVAWDESHKLRKAKRPERTQSGFIPAGREYALQQMTDVWQQAQQGLPQLVLLGGIAGIGKTEIARFVCDEIAATTNKVMIGWGAASSWATDMEPYLALRTAIDRILVEPDASSTTPGNYSSRPQLGSNEIQQIINSIPALAGPIISERTLLQLAESLPVEQSETINSLLTSRTSTHSISRLDESARLLEQFSKSWPLVIVLEDLHWAGSQMATLLLHFASQMLQMWNSPILIIGTFRNDEVYSTSSGREHPLKGLLDTMSRSPQVHTILLNETTSETHGMDFVRALSDQTPMARQEDAVALALYLYTQTSGHPLLSAELKRHLLESNALVQRDDQLWEFHSERIPKETPSAISTFVAQRLKRVSKRSMRILEIASVMNDDVLPTIIAEVMEEEEDEIVETINTELVDTHQLLLSAPSVPLLQREHLAYRFPHALYQEHIYAQTSASRRRRLHSAIAMAMEAESGEFDINALSEIASHYVLAEDWQNAMLSGFRLALNASFKMDWDLAEVWFPQAEALAIRAQDHQQLWLVRAARLSLLRGTSKYEEALELGNRILALSDIHDWPSTLALTWHYLGEIHYDLGKVEVAVDYLERALEVHERDGATDFAAAAMAMLSHSTQRQGKYDVARKHAQNALNLSKKYKNFWVQPEALFALANCEIDLGFYEQALESYSNVEDLAGMVGKPQTRYIPMLNVSLIHTLMGNHQKAINLLLEAIDEMNAHKLTRYLPYAYQYLGHAHEGLGNLKEAASAYATAKDLRRSAESPPSLYDSIAGELRIALAQTDNKTARSLMNEITNHVEQNGIEGIEYPLIVLVTVARAKAHFNDNEGYASYITHAYDVLMERAQMIEDEESHHSFLNNVQTAVDVQKLYRELNESARDR